MKNARPLFFASLILSVCLPGFLVAQISTPEQRQTSLTNMQRILDHPGEREALNTAELTDFFYPQFILDAGPTDLELLEEFTRLLQVNGVMALGGRPPILSVTKAVRGARPERLNLRIGQTITFTREGENFEVTLSNVTSNSYTLTLNQDSFTVTF